jgi:hypothetical protein
MRTNSLLLGVLLLATWAGAEEPTRDSLLAAWEEVQRSDPATLLFERLEPGLYRFETEFFPFDGEVRVLNTVVDDRLADTMDGFVTGMVEARLEGVDDDFETDYAYSIALWRASNTLYFDNQAGRWLTSDEFQERMTERYGGLGRWSWLPNGLFIGFLILVVIVLWWLSSRAGRQMKRATALQDRAMAEQQRAIELTEEALDISRDSNRVLREILATLRGSGGDPGDETHPRRPGDPPSS